MGAVQVAAVDASQGNFGQLLPPAHCLGAAKRIESNICLADVKFDVILADIAVPHKIKGRWIVADPVFTHGY